MLNSFLAAVHLSRRPWLPSTSNARAHAVLAYIVLCSEIQNLTQKQRLFCRRCIHSRRASSQIYNFDCEIAYHAASARLGKYSIRSRSRSVRILYIRYILSILYTQRYKYCYTIYQVKSGSHLWNDVEWLGRTFSIGFWIQNNNNFGN